MVEATPVIPATPAAGTAEIIPAPAPAASIAPVINEVLGEAGKKALEAERLARKEADKALAASQAKLKEYEDKDKSETQRISEERDALKADNAKLALENMRRDVAAETGLAPELVKRLQGSTREEMLADATDLLAATKPAVTPVGRVQQGVQTPQGAAGRIYTAEELTDHAFFMANKADILLAQREGRIQN